jgi:hypothetical protein
MIAALDLTEMEHVRCEPLVRGVLDYCAVALGPTPATWLPYLRDQLRPPIYRARVRERGAWRGPVGREIRKKFGRDARKPLNRLGLPTCMTGF